MTARERVHVYGVGIALGLVLLGLSIGIGLLVMPKVEAQGGPVTGALTGLTRAYAGTAYLKSKNFTATTTFTLVHPGPAVLGCVVIGKAGAAGSTITLYNGFALGTGGAVALGIIDATQVGQQFCYGLLVSGALGVAIASGGAAPDVIITYQGRTVTP